MTDQTHPLRAYSIWDESLRTDLAVEDAAAASVLRDPVIEHFRSDGREVVGAFPALAMQLYSHAERRDWEVATLVRLVGQDAVVAAHLIKASNSAYYAGVREIETLHDAVVRMGTREAADMALAAATRSLFDPESRAIQRQYTSLWKRNWRHALTTAAGARWLSRRLGLGDPERAFLGGLLHDIGKTFVLRSVSSLILSGRVRSPVDDRIVSELLEIAHLEVGEEVAVFWSFPEYLTSVCMLHHETVPREAVELHLVRIASAVEEIVSNPWYRKGLEREVEESSAVLGIRQETLEELASRIGDLGDRASAGF